MSEQEASAKIDARIEELADWRGEILAEVRAIVHRAVPDVVETWKYRGVPVWECDGVLCTGETYKEHVKLTFPRGASLPDPAGLFNGTTGGSTWRAIDIHEGDDVDAAALGTLVEAALAANRE